MRRTKQVIAVMVVATALCAADSSLAAAPTHSKPQSNAGLARTFASRITTNLRSAVAQRAIQPARTMEIVRPFPLIIREKASGVRGNFSPFQFRLPPPTR